MMKYLAPEVFVPFFLAFVRVSGIIFLFPLFLQNTVPTMVKVGLSFFISVIIFPLIRISSPVSTAAFPFALTAAKELIVGIIIGYIVFALFSMAKMAGRVMSFPSGFMVANVFDPTLGTQDSILGQFFYLVSILIFFIIDGHHLFIESIAYSFQQIGLGELSLSGIVIKKLIQYGVEMFYIAVQVAAPLIVSILLTDVSLGILARVIPQMNIFFVGLPLKLGLAIILMMVTVPVFATVFKQAIRQFVQFTTQILQAIG